MPHCQSASGSGLGGTVLGMVAQNVVPHLPQRTFCCCADVGRCACSSDAQEGQWTWNICAALGAARVWKQLAFLAGRHTPSESTNSRDPYIRILLGVRSRLRSSTF